jgi:hypothetical protein
LWEASLGHALCNRGSIRSIPIGGKPMKKLAWILAALGLMAFVAPAYAGEEETKTEKTDTADGAKKTKKTKKSKSDDGSTSTTTTEKKEAPAK